MMIGFGEFCERIILQFRHLEEQGSITEEISMRISLQEEVANKRAGAFC